MYNIAAMPLLHYNPKSMVIWIDYMRVCEYNTRNISMVIYGILHFLISPPIFSGIRVLFSM